MATMLMPSWRMLKTGFCSPSSTAKLASTMAASSLPLTMRVNAMVATMRAAMARSPFMAISVAEVELCLTTCESLSVRLKPRCVDPALSPLRQFFKPRPDRAHLPAAGFGTIPDDGRPKPGSQSPPFCPTAKLPCILFCCHTLQAELGLWTHQLGHAQVKRRGVSGAHALLSQCTPSLMSLPARCALICTCVSLRKPCAPVTNPVAPAMPAAHARRRHAVSRNGTDAKRRQPLAASPHCQCGEQFVGIAPMDRFHEGVDIGRRLGAVVDVIGVLIHIECQDRLSSRQRVTVVGSPLVDKLAVAH